MSFRPQDDLLEDRARLRSAVDAVLARLADGQRPDAAERQAVDLKEEAGRRGRGGVLLAPGERNLAAADSLADDVACMANSPGGGALVVGVEDATGSLLGTRLNAEWLRHRIWERIEVAPAIEEHTVSGVRLLVLYVAEAREPVEDTGGRLRWRTGDASTPVDRVEWWLHRQERAGNDPFAGPSQRQLGDIGPAALAQARRLLSAADLEPPASDRELLVRLGALRPDGAVTRAALEQLVVVEERLDGVNKAVSMQKGLVETSVRSLPPVAIREAVCNGLVEKQGLGVDRMVRELVSLGHRPPRLREIPGPRVRVRLSGGRPAVPVLALTNSVQPAVRRRDVRVALICHVLLREPYVTPALLAPVLQREPEEAHDALLAATDCRVAGEPLVVPYKDVWLLSVAAISVLEKADADAGQLTRHGLLPYRRPPSSEHVVLRWLRDHDTVTTGDTARLTGLSQQGALGQLERLERAGVLVRGAELGRNAHFVAGPAFTPAAQPGPLLSDRPAAQVY